MDEGAGLAPGSMNGERIADGGLHQEAVQHRAVIAVVIKAIGEPRVTVCGIGVGSPDDALVQVGDADLVVLVVVEEEQLVERLRHVINAAGACRVEDFLLKAAAVGLGHFHLEVALRDGGAAVGAIAVDTHRAEVHHVDVLTAFNDGRQQVVGAVDVVIDGVALGGAALHRVGGGPLFREVDHGIWALLLKQIQQPLVLMGDVHVDKPHRLAAGFLPGFEALTDAHDRRQRLNFKVDVDLATAEVVHDQNVVALIRQVHRTGPAAEAVTAEN